MNENFAIKPGAKILVTGCAGFIASRVTELLLAQGCSVSGIDSLNDAYDVTMKEWRLNRLKQLDGFRFYQADISGLQELRQLFNTAYVSSDAVGAPFDAVINLAARAGVRQSVANPWVYVDTNVTGTLNLLELCREFGVKKFIQASTSSLYGKDNAMPYREDANTDNPLSPYAASKKAAEALCYTYHYLYGIDVTVLRYFTVYGPAGRPDMSFFRFIQWINEEKPLLIYGDGQQSRDFTYVDDIAHGTIAALRPLGYETINLGSDRPVVLLDAVRLIEELLAKKAKLEFQSPQPADVTATWADINKARNLLGWEPGVTIEEGLRETCRWYRENRNWAKEVRVL
ncbi:MAG: GDP-mannose 4,6-dehydratase [Bacillota bacterium]